MESAQLWIRDKHILEQLQYLRHTMKENGYLTTNSFPYLMLALALSLMLIKVFKGRDSRPGAWLIRRPRSPDPEQTTDVNSLTEKRSKSSDRKFGSKKEQIDETVAYYANLS